MTDVGEMSKADFDNSISAQQRNRIEELGLEIAHLQAQLASVEDGSLLRDTMDQVRVLERRIEATRDLFTRETDEGPVYDFDVLDDVHNRIRLTELLG